MRVSDFWESTLDEIMLVVEAYNSKLKEDISLSYITAKHTALFVGCVLSGKPIPSMLELYPDLYTEEQQLVNEREQMEWQKEMMKVFADGRNHYLEVTTNGN